MASCHIILQIYYLKSIFLLIYPHNIPIKVPARAPTKARTPKYENILTFSNIKYATTSCPALWETAPNILTPVIEKQFIFLITYKF